MAWERLRRRLPQIVEGVVRHSSTLKSIRSRIVAVFLLERKLLNVSAFVSKANCVILLYYLRCPRPRFIGHYNLR